MRIIIDMQGAQTPFSSHRGVGRYTFDLVKAFINNSKEHEVFLALNGAFPESIRGIRDYFQEVLPQSNIVVWQQFLEFSGQQRDTYLKMHSAEILREAFLSSFSPDVIFSTNLQEGFFDSAPTSVRKHYVGDAVYVTTLHDVIPLSQPDVYLANAITKSWYQEKIDAAVSSDALVTVSNHSKNEILKYCDVRSEKVYSIHNAVDKDKFKPLVLSENEKANFLGRVGIVKPFILYSGGGDAHKNLDSLYKAFSLLPNEIKENYQLVMVGKELGSEQQVHRAMLTKLGINDNVVFTGFVSDDELISLYNLCYLFVFPSYREGFGLPVLEAMSCGAAVLSSGTSSIIEINSLEGAYFDPYSVDDIAKKIESAIVDGDFYSRLKKYAVEQSSRFSWDASACELLAIMQNLVNQRDGCSLSSNSDFNVENTVGEIIKKIISLKGVEELSHSTLACISQSIAETYPAIANRKNRLYLDVSAVMVNGDRTGIQRVVRAISFELIRGGLDRLDVYPIYKTPEDNFFKIAKELLDEIMGEQYYDASMMIDIDFISGDTLLFLDLHPSLAISHELRTDYLISKGVNVYHVVYDLLPLNLPQYFWPELCQEFKVWFESVLKSQGVVCISKAVADQVEHYIEKNDIKVRKNFIVRSFHLGANMESSLPTKGISDIEKKMISHLKQNPTFLMVGTIEPRKQQQQILDVFNILWSQDINVNLVFVGKKGWGVDKLVTQIGVHPELNNRFFWCNGISDECLDSLYSISSGLVIASEDEGFGLPLIEAAQHGIPIIARDIPVFREIAGEHAYYFVNKSAKDIAQEFVDWLALFKADKHPKSITMPWLTWKQSARQLLTSLDINAELK
ncbi:glycosyltransferase family 4 protein [Musicola paradisiaca]|uniref:Glycosyl transferase group 1 n=1 Tax=Musicola paradisiaca (strain Ech703) TaxID=579405 RepID=C6CDG9_MUSP7|nr:glycosyltransferase family 1 protein [Musicola paradisiaca]ACS87040.1 glycosyl transferase group 1 [Musicola paradisiaca Ech703]